MIKDENDHASATPIIRDAWIKLHKREGTPNEILYSQAIASFETGYGRLGQFKEYAKQGKFNWGAEQKRVDANGECPPGFMKGQDQGSVCFYVFPSDVDAAAAFLRTLTMSSLRPDTVKAMAGSPEDVAKAMRGTEPARTAYYAGNPNKTEEEKIQIYADGIRNRAKVIASALREAPLAPHSPFEPKMDSNSGITYSALIIAMAGSAWYITKKRKV